MSSLPPTENPYASPQSEEAPMVSNPTPAWRDGELVVVAPDGELPRRCAKCGGEASGKLHYAYLPKPEPTNWGRIALFMVLSFLFVALFSMLAGVLSTKKITWPSWIGKIDSKHISAAIVISIAVLMPLVLFAFALKKRPESLRYSLCSWHNVTNRIAKIGITLNPSFWMIVMILQPRLIFANGFAFPSITILMLVAAVFTSFSARIMFTPKETARRNDLVWLKGAGQAFRESLPEFPPELAIKNGAERQS